MLYWEMLNSEIERFVYHFDLMESISEGSFSSTGEYESSIIHLPYLSLLEMDMERWIDNV